MKQSTSLRSAKYAGNHMNIDAGELTELLESIFIAAGCSQAEAMTVAEHLVKSDLAGHASHGVVRTRQYVAFLDEGRVRAGQIADVVTDGGAVVVLDGGFGFGQSVGRQAVDLGIERARLHGVAAIGLRFSGHLGRIADWAEQAADAGLVSIHFVNVAGKPLVAPFGSIDRRFGTDPVAIGVPQADRPPLLIDFATSVVAEGKARIAHLGGPAVPHDAFVGPDGEPTGDPTVLYGPPIPGERLNPRAGPGALRAMGDQKGSALALACELLAGALIGSFMSGDEAFCNGMLSLYLSPDRFGTDDFLDQATRFADHVRAARPVAAGSEVCVPGDLERERTERQRRDGLHITDGAWSEILEAAEKVGVTVPAALDGSTSA